MNAARKAYEKKLENFRRVLLSWKSEKEIFELYEKCHAPMQVISLLRHENLENSKNFEEENVFLLSDSSLVKMLKDIVPYSKEQYTRHLSMPQWWKIRFRHLDKSEEEVKQLVEIQLQKWASNTHNIRRKKGTPYNPIQTLQYWVDMGLSIEDAQKKLLDYKRSCSPFTIDFWKNKGFSEEEAQEKASSLHKKGGIAACTSLNKKFVSKLEQDIFKQLQERAFHSLKAQHCINGKFVYDICDLKSKKIIEINGSYWHADPRVYSSNDMLVCNGLTASAVRERDTIKHEYAKKFGYDVLVIWEIDWHSDKEASIQKMLEFLGSERKR